MSPSDPASLVTSASPSGPDLEHLRLLALDGDDLAIISAHLQDAVLKAGDLSYLPDQTAFALLARRFDWETGGDDPRRRLTGLHIDRVLSCRSRGIDRSRPDEALNLLAVTFDVGDAPSGTLRLVFAGGASIELAVECIEARLKDLGPVWATETRPEHKLENT